MTTTHSFSRSRVALLSLLLIGACGGEGSSIPIKQDLIAVLCSVHTSPEAKGKYGPVLEVFPDRGEKLTKRASVGAPACYAIAHNGAEAIGHWDGVAFHLIRVDDIGKLN